MIIERAKLTSFFDAPAHTVMGYAGTYIVKMERPVEVKDSAGDHYMYNAFDLQQSRLMRVPNDARGFIVKGRFVERDS